jgi:hypothetical protein
MWWDVYLPKVVAEEHLSEVNQAWSRAVEAKAAEVRALQARLREIEESAGWKFVLAMRRRFDRYLRPDSLAGRVFRRAAHVWLERGTWRLSIAAVRKSARALVRRLIPRRLTVPAPTPAVTAESPPALTAAPPAPAPEPVTALAEARLPALRLAEPPPPRPALRLYTSSGGNYFFREMADLLAAGLTELGEVVLPCDETDGFGGGADDWHVILAPHEFFYIGEGLQLASGPLPANLVVINTEQPSTHWFDRTARFFPPARRVWDVDYLSSQRLLHRGVPCRYLPLGFVPGFRPFAKQTDLPLHYGTCGLEPAVRRRPGRDEPLSDRPLDVVFFGNPTGRRSAFFSDAAAVLAKYRCYFHFSDASKPLVPGRTTYMNTPTVVGLVQRAKVLLNVHREGDFYFEWQRIVMQGIWAQTLVVSEPCSPAPPFRPGIDFVEAPLGEIAERLDYYLLDPEGRQEAQAIAAQGYRTLSRDCRLRHVLAPLVAELLPGEPAGSPRADVRRAA